MRAKIGGQSVAQFAAASSAIPASRAMPFRTRAGRGAEAYFLIVNGTENAVFSHEILISPLVWWFSSEIVS